MHEPQFINPNFHIVFVHYPIALLIVGLAAEVLSVLGWRRTGLRMAGRWMIFLGALSSIPTALLGLYAMNELVRAGIGESQQAGHWADALRVSPLINGDPRAWAMMKLHAWINAGVAVALSLTAVFWAGGSETFRRFMYIPALFVVIVGVAATSVGAWYGGEMVYRRGVAVVDRHASPSAVTTQPAITLSAATEPTTAPADASHDWTYYAPPMQMHVLLAGFSVALALGAMAVSFRRANVLNEADRDFTRMRSDPTDYSAAFGLRPQAYAVAGNQRPDRQARPGIPPDDVDEPTPNGRFWFFLSLIALATAAFGLYLFLTDVGVTFADATRMIPELWHDQVQPLPRRMIHIISGGVIVLVPLLLALIAKWAPRQRTVLFIFTLWLLAAIAAQAWLGSLMLLDTPDGAWNAFHAEAP